MTFLTSQEWESIRPLVEDLYGIQHRSVAQVRDNLIAQGYDVNFRTVKNRISKWNLQRKIREHDALTAIDLLRENGISSLDGQDHIVIYIRNQLVELSKLRSYFQRRKISRPFDWALSYYRDSWKPSPHIKLAVLQEMSSPVALSVNAPSTQSPSTGYMANTPIQSESSDDIQLSQNYIMQHDLHKDASPQAAMYSNHEITTIRTIQCTKDYVHWYLASVESGYHLEPQVHHLTPHGRFGDRMQHGLFLLLRNEVQSAFDSFQSGFVLVDEVIASLHPMNLSLIFTTICQLACAGARPVINLLLDYIVAAFKQQTRNDVSVALIMSIMKQHQDHASLASTILQILFDVFKQQDHQTWKSLYIQERLCDCMYYCGAFEAGKKLRAELLMKQEQLYGTSARNTLWTLTNVADDCLTSGKLEAAEQWYLRGLSRARGLEGYGRAKTLFAVLEGLARTKIKEARFQCVQDRYHETIKRRLKVLLGEAMSYVLRAQSMGRAWFEPSSRRLLRILELKKEIDELCREHMVLLYTSDQAL